MRPPKICITFVILASLSLCGLAIAAMPPMGDARPEKLRNARRDLTDALKPSVAGAVKSTPESSRAGMGKGDAPQDPPPDADDDFIAADIGQEEAAPQDSTTFLGTVEVEAGTTPPPEPPAPPQ